MNINRKYAELIVEWCDCDDKLEESIYRIADWMDKNPAINGNTDVAEVIDTLLLGYFKQHPPAFYKYLCDKQLIFDNFYGK